MIRTGVDSPYSWIVCVCTFFINFLAVGSSFLVCGTMASYWRREMCSPYNRDCTDSEVALVQSLIVVFWMMIGAPVSKMIIPVIGYRYTLWLGGTLMMVGAVSSAFVPTIYWLYLTMGVIFGMGVGLSYLPHLLVAGEYFKEQRDIAFAMISSGNTIANLILVKLLDLLIIELGLKVGLITFGGIVFNIVVLAMPCIKLTNTEIGDIIEEIKEAESRSEYRRPSNQIQTDPIKSGFSIAESQPLNYLSRNVKSPVTSSFLNIQSEAPTESFISLKSAHLLRQVATGQAVHMSNADVSQLWMESQIAVDKKRKSSMVSKSTTWRDSVYVSLFKSKRYTLMFMCDTMGFFAYMIVMQYLTDKMTHAGLVRTDATWCIAILGIANTVSKLACGFLCNKKYLKTYSMYAWSHILSGITSCLIIFIESDDANILRYQCFAFSMVLGLTIGPYSLTPSVQADIVPFESMPSAMNVITVGEGIALMLGPIVAGKILDWSGKDYNLLFCVGGVSMLATGLLPLLVYLPFCRAK